VREFHPPPKVTQQAIPQKDHGSKESGYGSIKAYAGLPQYDPVPRSEPDPVTG